MCGVFGYAGYAEKGLMERMAVRLRHRGPDDEAIRHMDGAGIGHVRLAIMDPEGGTQPFYDEAGQIALVVNGEIYNHEVLRSQLERKGHRFRSKSDCEVLVHLYEERGERFVEDLNGMFAVAVWDGREKKLLLARDRLGIRPLYYARVREGLLFASETKALLESARVERSLDRAAVDEYLSVRYTSGERTFFNSVRRLLPGQLLIWQGQKVTFKKYWTLPTVEHQKRMSDGVEEEFSRLLEESVGMRLMSDVPVGLFLSGGVDSGMMGALVKESGFESMHTFSIGFGRSDDELTRAASLARCFKTQHQESVFSSEDLQLLPHAVWHLDEPIGDSVILPTFRLAQMAHGSVKVVLTGEGIDELLAGYVHHRTLLFLERVVSFFPGRWIKDALSVWVDRLPVWALDMFFHYPASAGKAGRSRLKAYLQDYAHASRAVGHFGTLFEQADKENLCTKHWLHELGSVAEGPALYKTLDGSRGKRLVEKVLECELATWLPDYTLHKQDKLLMAHSLEGRVPYLDHRLVELVSRLPLDFKLRGRTDKILLRKAAQRKLPAGVAQRKKQPFYFPLENGSMRIFKEMAKNFLSRERVANRGIFNPDTVQCLVQAAQQGTLLAGKQAMSLLILEIWFRLYVDGSHEELRR